MPNENSGFNLSYSSTAGDSASSPAAPDCPAGPAISSRAACSRERQHPHRGGARRAVPHGLATCPPTTATAQMRQSTAFLAPATSRNDWACYAFFDLQAEAVAYTDSLVAGTAFDDFLGLGHDHPVRGPGDDRRHRPVGRRAFHVLPVHPDARVHDAGQGVHAVFGGVSLSVDFGNALAGSSRPSSPSSRCCCSWAPSPSRSAP